MLANTVEKLRDRLGQDNEELANKMVDAFLFRWTGQTESTRDFFALRRCKIVRDDAKIDEASLDFQEHLLSDSNFLRLHWSFFSLFHYQQFETVDQTLDWFGCNPSDWDFLLDWWKGIGCPRPRFLVPCFDALVVKPPTIQEITHKWMPVIEEFVKTVCRKTFHYVVELYEDIEDITSRLMMQVLVKILSFHWKPEIDIRKLIRTTIKNRICDIARYNSAAIRSKHVMDKDIVCGACKESVKETLFDDGRRCGHCNSVFLNDIVIFLGHQAMCKNCNGRLHDVVQETCPHCDVVLVQNQGIKDTKTFRLRTLPWDRYDHSTDLLSYDYKDKAELATSSGSIERRELLLDVENLFGVGTPEYSLAKTVIDQNGSIDNRDFLTLASGFDVDIIGFKQTLKKKLLLKS